jgi:hypothetical protein
MLFLLHRKGNLVFLWFFFLYQSTLLTLERMRWVSPQFIAMGVSETLRMHLSENLGWNIHRRIVRKPWGPGSCIHPSSKQRDVWRYLGRPSKCQSDPCWTATPRLLDFTITLCLHEARVSKHIVLFNPHAFLGLDTSFSKACREPVGGLRHTEKHVFPCFWSISRRKWSLRRHMHSFLGIRNHYVLCSRNVPCSKRSNVTVQAQGCFIRR